ncbi:MAG: hypothetical protein HUJ51_05110 [Eggerthellaceae bacterium]|nr:hypothetical protein [Eggerthellaceae bacterium]
MGKINSLKIYSFETIFELSNYYKISDSAVHDFTNTIGHSIYAPTM